VQRAGDLLAVPPRGKPHARLPTIEVMKYEPETFPDPFESTHASRLTIATEARVRGFKVSAVFRRLLELKPVHETPIELPDGSIHLEPLYAWSDVFHLFDNMTPN
jgi:hypothetical protein